MLMDRKAAIDAAATLTMVLPVIMVINNLRDSFINRTMRRELALFSSRNFDKLKSDNEKYAVSDPEKKADRPNKITNKINAENESSSK